MEEKRIERRPLVSFSWREGSLADLWLVPHFLTGFALGIFGLLTALPFNMVLLVTVPLLTAWEVFEWFAIRPRETLPNQVCDILIGLLGFSLASSFLIGVSSRMLVLLGAATVILFTILAAIGWKGSLRLK